MDANALVAVSPVMRQAISIIDKAAGSRTPVVLVGPSGVGKERLAVRLHQNGPRSDHSFVSVACAAIPEGLAESMFFGHVRGAFSGAHQDAPGFFGRADGGTMFLDDVAMLGLPLQAKLLRALDCGEVQPVGGTPRVVDVRVVAASQFSPEELVRVGRFREDLCYRLAALTVCLPPLSKRPEDVEALITRELTTRRLELSPEARRYLFSYPWPGNVRELLHVIEAASVLVGEERVVGLEHLPERITSSGPLPAIQAPLLTPQEAIGPTTPDHALDVRTRTASLEQALMAEALRRTNGNRRAAARLCGLSPRAFLYKLREYGLDGH